MAFNSPNYTQTPNDLFDEHMRDMKESELKVVLVIVRKTLGWQKKADPISLTTLETMTGLSRQACLDGVNAAVERGIVCAQKRRGKTTIYRLSVEETSQDSRPVVQSDQSNEATSTSQDSRPVEAPTSPLSRPTKEIEEKEKEKKSLEGQTHPQDGDRAREATAGVGVEILPIEDFRSLKNSLQIPDAQPPDWALGIARHKLARGELERGDAIAYAWGVVRQVWASRPIVQRRDEPQPF